MSRGVRSLRVSAQMRETLPELISSHVRDPRLTEAGLLCLNHAEINRDLSVATVYVSFIGGVDASHKKAVEILNSTAPILQGALGRKLAMKRAPKLRFRLDPGPEMHQRLAELAKGEA